MGIKATMGRLSSFLRAYDEELWHHLEVRNRVNPQFYAFRWITLLLTQVGLDGGGGWGVGLGVGCWGRLLGSAAGSRG